MKVSAMLKVMAIVMCVAAVSAAFTGVALADGGAARDVLEKQAEIDKYLFEDHAEDIAALGITVTHTSPGDTYVEIGITPYTEQNAEYLYGIFGRDMVKVVEGEQAVLLTGGAAALEAPAEIPEGMLDKQAEIDKYLFEDHTDDIAALGITVTHTSPGDTYVEIGITPYSEENAEYLYGIFGRDMVKVVEGEQAVTLEYGKGTADSGPVYAEEDAQASPFPWVAAVLAVAAVAAGATVVLVKRKAVK